MGGIGGRRSSVGSVVLVQQPFALVATIIVWALYRSTGPTAAALAWGALSGLGNGLGTVALYRGLALGRMSVAAPLSAVLAAAIPAVVGIALGERLSAPETAGIVMAAPAIVLVSLNTMTEFAGHAGVWEGLASGVGFGMLFVALDRAGTASGAWPLLPSQAVTFAVAIPLGVWMSRGEGNRRRAVPYGAAAGALGALAAASFLGATGHGELAVVAVLTALYPAVTVLLARLVLGERWSRVQGVGLVAAALSVALMSVGSSGG